MLQLKKKKKEILSKPLRIKGWRYAALSANQKQNKNKDTITKTDYLQLITVLISPQTKTKMMMMMEYFVKLKQNYPLNILAALLYKHIQISFW